MTIQERIAAVELIYQTIDESTARFQAVSQLKCQSGCGRCCENPKVEATILEVLPLAWQLWQMGKAQEVFDQLVLLTPQTPCVFFQAGARAGHGRCSVYANRPLICRLFGFAGIPDKYGNVQLLTCPTIKEYCQEAVKRVAADQAIGQAMPTVPDYAMQVAGLDPQLAREHWPINMAVAKAIEKIGLSLRES